jgi:molecular chaperone DnaK (HSP70)
MTTPVLGVDIGNTTCSVALYRQGQVDVVTNAQGNRSTPSVVGFTDVEPLLGEAAKGQLSRNPQNTVVDVLLLIGRGYEAPEVQAALKRWRFRVTAGKDGDAQIEVQLKGEAKVYSPQRLLSLLLAHLRAEAESYAGVAVKDVVIAMPPHFNEAQRNALKEAAQMGVRCRVLQTR